MISRLIKYVKDQHLVNPSDCTLIALSGGIDSVVLCSLFQQAGFSFGIAHCNFKLRGNESDQNEKFVEGIADQYQVPFHLKSFDTEKYANDNKLSTQMAARDLRYEWFEEIRLKHNYTSVATAHHKDDQVETLFINLFRGTGLPGLHGILPRQKNLIRPLLFADRKQIIEYKDEYKLAFQEDSSNASDKYLRNKIRHHLAPALEKIDPEYLNTFEANMIRFQNAEDIYLQKVENIRDEILSESKNEVRISIDRLKKLNPISTYLYELLKPYNFSFQTSEDIIGSLNNEPGKLFYSRTHKLLKDRDYLIIRAQMKETTAEQFLIPKDCDEINSPINLKIKKIKLDNSFKISDNPSIASLDKRNIVFPLKLRKWKQGDYFIPLGTKNRKKLSDYFIDRKFSIFEKEDCWLLCAGEEIIWIVGYQISNRYKVSPETSDIIQFEFVKN